MNDESIKILQHELEKMLSNEQNMMKLVIQALDKVLETQTHLTKIAKQANDISILTKNLHSFID